MSETKMAYVVGVDHRIQYTNAACGLEWAADIRKFEDYLVEQASSLEVDLLAEEFNEELVGINSASGCTVRDAARRSGRPHLFCDPNHAERSNARISNNDQREEEWLARIERTKAQRPLMVCGDTHIESFSKRLHAAGFSVTVLSRNWGANWQLKQ